MFSNQGKLCPQEGQWEAGNTILSPLFQRRIQTFKKLPIQTPHKKKRGALKSVGGMEVTSL